MTKGRDAHLAWCRRRALQILDEGDPAGAVASMVSDLRKAEPPLYDLLTLQTLTMDGMLFRETQQDVRNWIEGFA